MHLHEAQEAVIELFAILSLWALGSALVIAAHLIASAWVRVAEIKAETIREATAQPPIEPPTPPDDQIIAVMEWLKAENFDGDEASDVLGMVESLRDGTAGVLAQGYRDRLDRLGVPMP